MRVHHGNHHTPKKHVHQEEVIKSNMSQEGKAILESKLGSLLGFEDGASDVLEHLLSIESREVRRLCLKTKSQELKR